MQLIVVIVNYNSISLVQRCLEALGQQTRSPDRIVVVDNASTDTETHDVLTALAAVDVIFNEENRGYGAAINQVCDGLAEDDLLVCLNPDAFPEPDCLAELEAAAGQHPDMGSFATLMLKADDSSIVDGAGDLQDDQFCDDPSLQTLIRMGFDARVANEALEVRLARCADDGRVL